MISSISKNKDKNADIDSLCSALLNGSLFRIPTKYIDIRDTHYYNKSSFDSGLLRYTISTESLNTQRGRNYRIYRMIKGDEYYFMITLSSVDRVFTRMKRCVIQKCDGEEVADTIWDYVNKNQLQMTSVNETLKGCEIVADTYRAFEVIESFLCWYYKSESNKGVKRFCVDSELYKYVTITGIIFKNLCFGNTSDLQIDVVCYINSGEDGKVRDLIDTLNTPMNMFAHINSGSLIISLLLKS